MVVGDGGPTSVGVFPALAIAWVFVASQRPPRSGGGFSVDMVLMVTISNLASQTPPHSGGGLSVDAVLMVTISNLTSQTPPHFGRGFSKQKPRPSQSGPRKAHPTAVGVSPAPFTPGPKLAAGLAKHTPLRWGFLRALIWSPCWLLTSQSTPHLGGGFS